MYNNQIVIIVFFIITNQLFKHIKMKRKLLNANAIMMVSFLILGISSCSKEDYLSDSENNGWQDDVIQVLTGEVTQITDNSAQISGSVNLKEGVVDIKGFLVGENENITITNNSNNIRIEGDNSTFTKTINGLQPHTKYFYRAYSLYGDKYYYGAVRSFTTEKEKEALVKIKCISSDGMSINIQYEPSSEVDYYYCYIGTNSSESIKCTGVRKLKYDELKPGKDYVFNVIAYTKDGKKNAPIRAAFSTKSSPYANYLCVDGEFYKFTGAESWVQYDYTSVNSTGTNFRFLNLYLSNDTFVQFKYGVHQWESVSSTWGVGTYNIENSGRYYAYTGYYNDGRKTMEFDEGILKISKDGGKTIIDFECFGYYYTKYFIGHLTLQ